MLKSPKKIIIANSLIFTAVLLAVLSGCYFLIAGQLPVQKASGAADEDPPMITNITVDELTATSAVIIWETDEKSDATVNYSLDKNYGVVRDSDLGKTSHKIELKDLLPNTTYFFRVISSDDSSNQNISNDYIFKTSPVGEESEPIAEKESKPGEGEEISEGSGLNKGEAGQAGEGSGEGETGAQGAGRDEGESEKAGQGAGESLEQALEAVGKIQSIEALETIVEKIQQQAQGTSDTPFIIESAPEIIELGSDYVTIIWRTSIDSNSIIALSGENNYYPDAADPYAWKEGEPDIYGQDHSVTVNGLQPATLYHFQSQSRSKVGTIAKSADRTFTTRSIMPEIYNINIEKLEEEAATIVWYTNVPCSSMIEYTNLENNETKSEGNPNFVTRHSVRLANLIFDTTYAAIIKVENEYGEKNNSTPLTFTTVRDILPPVISKVGTESTIYPGADAKIQTIITWETDEQAACQFFYHQGLFSKGEENSLAEETSFSDRHIQVAVVFQPATVYKFWIKCKDRTGNQSKSEDFTLLTPQKEQSIIDIIIANFQSTFGWVKKIGQ